jgi:two-component system OmpR family response regulator
VRATASGTEAGRMFADDPPDVVVLDVGLPDADGRDVCQALRARGMRSPVLFLTARDAVPDRLSGFHAGGDDYLTKPFALSELLVRVHALVRRAAEVVRRAALVAAGWPDGAIVHDNTLDAYVARIRRKLREAGSEEAIATVRGVGYRLP